MADVVGCIRAGAKVEARNKSAEGRLAPSNGGPGGFTPLHRAAARNESPAVVAALVEAGARVEARTIFGETPLHMAAGNNENPAVMLRS